jgi:long-chain acyl-CoA synthetase
MNEKKAAALYPEHVSCQFDIPNITLCDILQERAKQYRDNPALTFYEKTIILRRALREEALCSK